MPCHRNLASTLSLLCFFLLQKEAWRVWWSREMAFFCAVLKSVPEVLWEAQVSVGALYHYWTDVTSCYSPGRMQNLGTLPSKPYPALVVPGLPWDPCTCVAFRLKPWVLWEDCFLCVLYRIASSAGISQVLLPVRNGWMVYTESFTQKFSFYLAPFKQK